MVTRKQVVELVAAPTESTAVQVPRALIASVFAAAVDVGGYTVLVKLAGWNPLFAATLTYLLGGVVQYVLCSIWVFPASPQSVAFGFAAFTVLSLVGLGITNATIFALYNLAHLDPVAAKIVALGLAFCWNFLSRKYWLFKAKN